MKDQLAVSSLNKTSGSLPYAASQVRRQAALRHRLCAVPGDTKDRWRRSPGPDMFEASASGSKPIQREVAELLLFIGADLLR